jgi:mitochondrial fission protein ELM1
MQGIEVKHSNCQHACQTVTGATMTPFVWILASPHTGDNTQLFALAENLGWPFEVKVLEYTKAQTLARLTIGATLRGVTTTAREQIKPPFPDVILGAGRPTEAVALWIKKYAKPNVKLVYLGTPWAKLDQFDLVITTPQYGLPERANILHNQLPMHKITPEKLAEAARIWSPRFAHLPKPWTAVLVGGKSGPYGFGLEAARRLSAASNGLEGSCLVTTSARTPKIVTEQLQSTLRGPHYFHGWQAGSAQNPFLGFLALADQFIVTADSISMLAEACATKKPVTLFDTESGSYAMNDGGGPIAWLGQSLSATAFRFAMRLGPANWSRDLRVVHQQLIKSDRAYWLDAEPKLAYASLPNDLERATTRVQSLFNL